LRFWVLPGWRAAYFLKGEASAVGGNIARFHRPEKTGRDVPAVAVIRENADRFFVVADQGTDYGPPILWIKRDAVTDGKLGITE